MHELPVTQSILDLALDHAARAGAARITGVHLVVGDLSHIVDESIQFYWNILSEGTPAENARLRFTRVPLRMECRRCGTPFEPDGTDYRCPACSGTRVRVVAGDDFRMESIEVEGTAGQGPRERSSAS
jgi:hydrogenase nickel incorporation protein HypA/HybF